MASAPVRNHFRAALTAPGAPAPYVETIETPVDEKSLPALWVTLAFTTPATVQRCCLSDLTCSLEAGIVEIYVFGQGGRSDNGCVDMVEQLAAYLARYDFADPRFTLESIGVPNDLPQLERGAWYTIDMAIEYRYTRAT
jgi:hypothetical protein